MHALSACPLSRILRHHNGSRQAATRAKVSGVPHRPLADRPDIEGFSGFSRHFASIARLHSQRSAVPIALVGPGWPLFPFRPPPPFGLRRDKPPALEKEPRARGTPLGPNGPARLGASRHRGALNGPACSHRRAPQVRQSQGVPRAVFGRFAPHGPRWTYLSGNLPYGSLPIHRCRAQTDADLPATGCRLRPSPGPRGARLARRDTCGLDRRAVRIASPMHSHSPATAPRPVSEDAEQTPLGNEAGCD